MKFRLSTLTSLILFPYASCCIASVTHESTSFNSLVANDAQLPAIQIFKAENASEHQNYNEAAKFYIKSIELGLSAAVWNLMKFVDNGSLNGKPLQNAIAKIESMASNDVELSLFLGNYYDSRKSDEDKVNAFNWLNNSLRLGAKNSGETLADYIIAKKGKANEYYTSEEAATLLKRSADDGSGTASYKLAKLFYDGKLVARNLGQARYYFDIASKEGIIEADFKLAYFLENGIGGKKDLKHAAKLYEQILNTKDAAKAHYRLSRLYMYNDETFENAKIDGVAHLIKAAELGNQDALYKVGVASYYGSDGFKININNAIQNLKRAAYAGNRLAAQRLVQIYQNGDRNIKPNKAMMKEFLRILHQAPKL